MAKKKIKKTNEPGFIPGIYNYCDRWCEKCQFQLQCVSFVMGKRIEEREGFNPDAEDVKENESLWGRLKNIFESTYEILQELADERGMKVEDIYASEQIDKEFWGHEIENVFKEGKLYLQIENTDILKICRIYEHWGDRCLEKILKFSNEAPAGLEEDLEIVSWYLDLMQSKMRRALHSCSSCKEMEMCGTEEYNGVVKVALIAIERSEESWKNIQKVYTENEVEIAHLLAMLEQLKTDIECLFPYARDFLRPGFEKSVNCGI